MPAYELTIVSISEMKKKNHPINQSIELNDTKENSLLCRIFMKTIPFKFIKIHR